MNHTRAEAANGKHALRQRHQGGAEQARERGGEARARRKWAKHDKSDSQVAKKKKKEEGGAIEGIKKQGGTSHRGVGERREERGALELTLEVV